jgi:putative transposase
MVGGRRTTRLEELIRETAPELECEIVALEMMPDHLHLVVSATPQIEAQRTRG